MQSGFIRHIFFLITVNLIVKPFYVLIIDRGVQNELGTSTYGLFFALFNLSYIIYILSDLGIYQYHTRQVASGNTSKWQSGQIAGVKLWLSGLYLVSLLLLATLFGYTRFMPYVLLLGTYQLLVSWVFFLRSQLNGKGLYRVDAWVSILDRTILTGVIGGLLLTPVLRTRFTLLQFIALLIFSMLVTLWAAHRFLRHHGVTIHIRPVRLTAVGPVIRQTLPFALTVILMTLYTRIDGIMLERLAPGGDYQAGVYAASYRLLDAANMVAYLVATLLLPIYSRHLQQGLNVGPLYRDAFKLLWVVSGITSVAAVAFAGPIMHLLYPDADDHWAKVFAWLMPTFVFGSIIYVAGTLVTASGRLNAMNRAAGVSIAANILLNVLLIPRYLALGAVVATLVTQGAMALSLVFIAYRRFQLAQTKLWLGAGGLILIWSVLAWILLQWEQSWMVQLVVFVLVALAAGAVTGWLPLKTWWLEFKAREGLGSQ